MGPPTGKFVVRYGLTYSPDCKSGLTYTPDYKSGGTGIIGLQIWWNWIRWNWGWETISWNAMNHHLRRKSFKTCASSFETWWIIIWRDESFETWWIIWDVINHVSTLFICLFVIFVPPSKYIFIPDWSISSSVIEVYILSASKYNSYCGGSTLPCPKINWSVP